MSVAITDRFSTAPDNARLWVIAADRSLGASERTVISRQLNAFFGMWASHGRKVEAAYSIEHDRFIVVVAWVPGSDVSGCGIDASVRELDAIANEAGFARAPVLDIFFHDGERVQAVDRARFAALANAGVVSRDTTVFDTSISSAADWRQGRFAPRAADCWHADVFF